MNLVKNLTVLDKEYPDINKFLVHRAVNFLKNELKLSIEFLEINFVSKEVITIINKKYLQHNYSTDIITFDYSQNNSILDAEIFISKNDAAANAKKYNITKNDEFLRLITHGILHLIGYNDQKPDEKSKMKLLEDTLVRKQKKLFQI